MRALHPGHSLVATRCSVTIICGAGISNTCRLIIFSATTTEISYPHPGHEHGVGCSTTLGDF